MRVPIIEIKFSFENKVIPRRQVNLCRQVMNEWDR